MTAETTSLPVRRSPFGKRPRQPVDWLMLLLDRHAARWLLAAFALALLVSAGVPAWRHLYPASAGEGWHYSLYLGDIERVSALLPDDQGNLYISQEHQDGKGRILRYSPTGHLGAVESGLSNPDGMASYMGGVAFSQEQGRHPVNWMNPQGTRQLFSADSVEGLTSDGHYLYAVEDLHGNGRLLRYDPQTDSVTTLRRGLHEAEAVASCPDGRLYYSEKGRGQVRLLAANGRDPVVLDGLREPGFMLCNHDGLWITEDATHMARVLRLDSNGRLEVVLSHLRSPQTIVETAAGRYLVAEQGRNRILELRRRPQ
ncbi:hypothetical protein [Metapseudomonas resinovorans]|uniref:Strictosidine synthase conserved region domain-containing protein n=1 Tax=Metapseudomonas resinovorans NBRC 106553 TaxID=1245471 RepID=S6AWJ6_METRE|nr:hypothetical protein [Pseudomonas resinovorans]BAN48941.1 hypothetical protein PCA10_32090 [Pseudomonas resinovorans NBRC 106553]